MTINKNIKLIVNYFLGPLVFLFLCFTIYYQLSRQANWKDSFHLVGDAFHGFRQWKFWLALLLMGVNWGLEALKWQYCNQSLERISFGRAYKAVLAGIAIASFTPNRIGEYIGRVLFLEKDNRAKSVSLTIVGSMAQFLVTIFLGVLEIIYLQWYLRNQSPAGHPFLHLSLNLFMVFTLVVLIALVVLYFRLSWLVSWVSKLDSGMKFIDYVKVVKDLPPVLLLKILCLSFIRYLIFIVQYGLLFSLFGVQLTVLQLFGGIAAMFFVMAIVPTFTFLTDLGLRWEASIQIMELFSANTIGIFGASFGIWIVNLIIPALIGSLLILRIKIFNIDEGI